MDLTYNVRITPGFERHLELDPMTNAFTRGPPAASASRTASAFSLHRVRGFEYRVMLASTMELKNCFALALDRQF